MTTARYGKAPILERYRPGGALWFLVLLFPGMGCVLPAVMVFTPHTHMDLIQVWSLAGVTTLFGVGLAMLLGKAIDADDAGLTCWDRRGKRCIRWEDVQDYYLYPPRERSQSAAISTAAGDIVLSGADRGYEDLLRCVPAHTEHLPVREWGVLGFRPNDPATIVFRYTWRTQAVFGVMFAALTLGTLVMVSHGIIRDWQLLRQFAGLGWAIGFAVLALHLPVMFGLMSWVCYLETREAWGRRNDRITITSTGIRFENAMTTVDAPWTSVMEWHSQEVTRRRLRTSNLVIVTQRGTFDVSSRIGSDDNLKTIRLLRLLLEQYAGPDTQPLPEDGVRADATKRWANRIAEGAQVHHYRTPVNRAQLLMVYGYALAMMTGVLTASLAGTAAVSTTKVDWMAIVSATVIGYTQWRYRTAAVITDNAGIRVFTAFGERRLAWSEVVEYRKGAYLATVEGRHGAIRFWLTISDIDQLQKTIQERAVNSKTRAWKP